MVPRGARDGPRRPQIREKKKPKSDPKQNPLQLVFWIDFGRILEGFQVDWGEVWELFGVDFVSFLVDLG